MKRIRKAAVLLAAICLLCPCISMVVQAAPGQLQFSDPSTTVGAEFEVKVKLTAASSITKFDATLSYDKEMLRFVSGESATGGDGAVTISATGNGAEVAVLMKFQALKEGTAQISVGSSSGSMASGEALQITNGTSAVTIGPGDPSLIQSAAQTAAAPTGTGAEVTVDDIPYKISNDFSDALIPTGFSKSEMTYEGTTCQIIKQDTSDESAMYLVPAAGGEGDFFMYNKDKGTFAPFEAVDISTDRYIVLLRNDGGVKLSDEYVETILTLNGKDFPVWNNSKQSDYYVVYALNSDGQKALYQYDNVDKTYQRFIKPTKAAADTTTDAKGILGKISNFIQDNVKLALIGIGALLAVLLLVLIVIGVKLRHRNLELDDLYEEYGIDAEDNMPKGKSMPQAAAKGSKKSRADKEMKPAVRKPSKELYEEDDFEDYDDGDDLMDDDFDAFEDMGNLDEDDFDEATYDDDEFDNTQIEDLDEMLAEKPKKKRSHMEDDDAFKVDFIDLD